MAGKSVAEKARVKAGSAIAVLNGVQEVVDSLGLPPDVVFADPVDAQLVFLFVKDRAELDEWMAPAVSSLLPHGALWVFYRKGSKAAGLDLNRDDIWAAAERMGLRPLGLIGVDDTWSVFRLRPAPLVP